MDMVSRVERAAVAIHAMPTMMTSSAAPRSREQPGLCPSVLLFLSPGSRSFSFFASSLVPRETGVAVVMSP